MKKLIITCVCIIVAIVTIILIIKIKSPNLKLEFPSVEVSDVEKPVITINGDEIITLNVGDEYVDKGATAYDNNDGDITDKIEIENKLDIQKAGEYKIVYTVKDKANNIGTNERTVIVKEKEKPKETKKKINNKKLNVTKEIKNDEIDSYFNDTYNDISIGYYDFNSNAVYYYNKKAIYYGASLIKTLDAIYLYDNNKIDDNLKEYVKKAISVSDNDAHKYLINYIGKDNLKKYAASLGAKHCLETSSIYGNTTVEDQLIYLNKLYELIKKEKELKSYFVNDLGNYLKIDGVEVLHKYGYLNEFYHDVGIIMDDRPYALVVLTKYGSSDSLDRKKIISDISNYIYNKHKNNEI